MNLARGKTIIFLFSIADDIAKYLSYEKAEFAARSVGRNDYRCLSEISLMNILEIGRAHV